MPGTETPGTGVFLPISFPAPADEDVAAQGQTVSGAPQQAKPASHHHKSGVGRSRTFSAASNSSQHTAAPDSRNESPQGATPQQGHHTHGCHRNHSFSYFRPREQQQWADTTAWAPAAPQLRPTSTSPRQPGWGPNTSQVQPRVMAAEGSPRGRSVMAAAPGACSSAFLLSPVSPTATAAAAAGGGGGGTVVGAAGSSICSSSYCDAPRASWSSSGCSSGRSSIDARGGTAAAAYHSAFYHSSQLQQAGTPAAAAGPSCSTAAPAGSGAVGYHRLLPVQPGEEQHLSHHSLGFDPAASHSGLLAQQLQPSMFGTTDLATAGSRSDLSMPLLLAHDGARLQLLQQLQQAPSALDLEEQINKELLWLLELRQRLTHTSPSASAASAAAASAAAAAGRAAAGSTSDTCVRGRVAAVHYQQVMVPVGGGHPQHQPACWFDDSAGRIHSGAPAACAAGFSNASSAALQPAVGAGPAAVALQRAHSGGLGSRLPSGSLSLQGAGGSSSNSLGSRLPSGSFGLPGSSSNSLGSCSTNTSNRCISNNEQHTVTADMAPADVAAVVQTKLQQLQMIQELQGDLEAELLQLLPM